MVLTRQELINSLQNEVRILLHLIGKIEPQMVDYRPTAKQRSTLELLQYLVNMGPGLLGVLKTGQFDPAAWQARVDEIKKLDLAGVTAAIAKQSDQYAELVNTYSDDELRADLDLYGTNLSRGSHIVRLILGGHAAYRTQLFLYLKSCGREELNTYNLWGGIDGEAQAAN